MFGCAIAANITYGAGILCRVYSWPDLLGSAPWILGSLGTVSLDVVIFLQVRQLMHACLDFRYLATRFHDHRLLRLASARHKHTAMPLDGGVTLLMQR
jgi:hypothetical protein